MPEFANKVEFEDVRCQRATGAAIQVVIDGKTYWIPQSQVDDDSEVYQEGHRGKLVVSEWIAVEKGLV